MSQRQTRFKGNYMPGFYNKVKIIDDVGLNKKKRVKRVQAFKYNDSNQSFLKFKNKLQIILISCLKRSKDDKLKYFKIDSINAKFLEILLKRYKINCRYSNGKKLLKDFQIITKSYISENEFYQIQPDSFVIKLNKEKIYKYKNKSLNENFLTSDKSLSIKFLIERNNYLTQEEIEFIKNFNKNN